MSSQKSLLRALPNGTSAYLNQYSSRGSKFLSVFEKLPSEWENTCGIWMNKPDFETMGLDDLYNNFKIVEQKVKRTVAVNNDDKNLAFLTTSSPSSTNSINTANTGVSTGNSKVNTASAETSTASFSDATAYAFLSSQPQGSQLVHEDLEQIHDDDLEEMDLKWNMALLSMRARKFYQRTGRKIIIDGSSTAGYDKSKVECFNCHKMGHFARECRVPRSKDNRNWNQGSSSKAVRIEDASEKAMCAIDGGGFDWSDMAEDEIQANMALMAFTDSEVSIDKSCSKSCLQNYEALKKQYNDLLVKLDDTAFKAATYKRGLSILEAQVVKYKESEVLFSEEIALLKRSVGHKDYLMGLVKTELEKVKEEKEGFEFKLAKFEKSSKDLDDLLASQVTDKSKRGFGYTAVPSPHPLILNRPTPLDLSYSGLEEFKHPEINGYGPRDSISKPTTVCDRESNNSKKNTDDFLTQKSKSVTETISDVPTLKVDKKWKEKLFNQANNDRLEEPKKTRENMDAPIIEDWVSDDEEEVKSISKEEKKANVPIATEKESLKPVSPSRKSIRPNVNTVRARGFNAVKPSACWSNYQLNEKGFVDSGCSRHMSGNIAHLSDFKEFDGGFVTFGGGANGGRITGKGTIKTDKLDFEDVYFVKELKFNLFSVSQMCDKKNYVLFTDSKSDNGTEFKNHVMDEFCREKGIKREYSVARTPQQNGVAERKNRTLIEAARTMLADSKLPTTFWAEAVSTACYVQNRVLVVKPHNKTPYELFRQSFRVNTTIRTRKVRKLAFVSENQTYGGGTGMQEGSESNISSQKDQDCIFMPIWKDASYFEDIIPQSVDDVQLQGQDGTHDDSSFQEDGIDDHQVNTASPQVNTASPQFNTVMCKSSVQINDDNFLLSGLGFLSAIMKERLTRTCITCLFACFLSSKNQKFLSLSDLAWHNGYGTNGSTETRKDERGMYDILFGTTKKELCEEFEKLIRKQFSDEFHGELTFFFGVASYQQKKKGIFNKKSTPGVVNFWEIGLNSWHARNTLFEPLLQLKLICGCSICCGQSSDQKPIAMIMDVTDDEGSVTIHASIDGHSLSISEGSLRRHLKLDDQDGITSLPPTEIFAQLALMGYVTNSDKLTFQKDKGWEAEEHSRLFFQMQKMILPKQGRKFSKEGFKDDEGMAVEKQMMKNSTGWQERKILLVKKVFPPLVTAGVHISTAGEPAPYPRISAEKRKDRRLKYNDRRRAQQEIQEGA
ncbi:gag-pol polyprotein [Tanacetum coccineum]